ncbi:MAG: glycosyl hydrolase, partial [Acidobacteria bacterium]
LPQFHPIPENDAWWGKGFTEWTNVVKAKPLFRGHYQPHLPAGLGFYDLRLPEVRQAQVDLAREYGLYGFCYYHYWFNGKRLLHRPFDEVLASGNPDFPFCLCWANENWTRIWDGGDSEVLMKQTYSEEDDLAHIRWLAHAFADSRYIRVENKPLFIIYRAHKLPDLLKTTTVWREECRRLGIGEVFLCRIDTASDTVLPSEAGLDAAVEFQPDWGSLGPVLGSRHRKRFHLDDWRFFLRRKLLGDDTRVYDYSELVETMSRRPLPPYPRFPCVTPSWDNSPRRRSGATVFLGSTPELFERWLTATLSRAVASDNRPPILFMNAWNEWGEGNHLEPDQQHGRSYLEAVRGAVSSPNRLQLPLGGFTCSSKGERLTADRYFGPIEPPAN